jgi:hypothetical protein
MIRDFLLGLRLAVGGGRISGSAVLRLAMTTLGIALAVAVLLPAASFGHVMGERADRKAAGDAVHTPVPGVAPLLGQYWSIEFRDHYVRSQVVAATGPTSPIPPGLARLPAPGEVVVSRAVQEILDSPDGAALRGRFPGPVVGTIDKPGVVDRGDLIMYVGARPDQVAGDPATSETYAFGKPSNGFAPDAVLSLFLAPAAAVLLLPLLIFVTTASRMGAAQRDRRLAALRLIGLDARQIRRVAAGESLVGAAAGLVLGVGLFLALRSQMDKVDLFGLRVYGDDFRPAWQLATLIVVLVPLLAVGSALFGLRRTIIEPLGVVRLGKPEQRRMWWRWAITTLGGGLLISTLFAEKNSVSTPVVFAITAGSTLSLIGVATVLPWAVERLIRGLRGGPPSWQLAIRRLQLDSGTASRVVSGLVIVLAGSILIQALVASLATSVHEDRPVVLGSATVRVSTTAALAGDVVRRATSTPGITSAEVLQSRNIRSDDEGASSTSVEIGTCAVLASQATLPSCTDGDTFYVDPEPDSDYQVGRAAPTGTVRLVGSYQKDAAEVPWTVPDTVRHIPAAEAARNAGDTLLVTPAALRGTRVPGTSAAVLVSGQGGPDAVSDRIGAALTPLAWQASVSTIGGEDYRLENEQQAEKIRRTLLFVSVFVLVIAALSLLLLSVEQITERRRPLAALSASGVPISVLAKGTLWQVAVPVGVGVVLSVLTGIGVTAPILRISGFPLTFDVAGIGILVAAAVLAVLAVTALTLPLLRSVTRLDGLRAE